jgi:hypothetical protein
MRRWELPRRRTVLTWRERWESPTATLEAIETRLRSEGAVVVRGGPYDRWDLAVMGGVVGGARLVAAVEEHDSGYQLVRVRWWPRCSWPWLAAGMALLALSIGAGLSGAGITAAVLFAAGILPGVAVLHHCGAASGAVSGVLERLP